MNRREEIFTKVVEGLRGIQTTNTYTLYGRTFNFETDIGDSVHPWRAAPFDEDELPGLIVRDIDELRELSSPNGTGEKRSLHVLCSIATDGDASPEMMRKIFGDIDGVFGTGRSTGWDSLSTETRPKLTRTIVDQESLKITGGIYEVYIDYVVPAFLGRTA